MEGNTPGVTAKRAREVRKTLEEQEKQDRERPYDGFTYITKGMKKRLDKLLAMTQEQRRKGLQRAKEMILEMKEIAREHPYQHEENSPEHVKELMSRWDISFFYLMTIQAISRMESKDVDVFQMMEFYNEIFELGIDNTPGYRTRNGLWEDAKAYKLSKEIELMRKAKAKGKGAFRKRTHAWYDGIAATMMVDALEAEIKNGRWYRVPEERIKGEQDPVLGFPKHEPRPGNPEKRRLCVDKRAPNALEVILDKVQIPGALATVEALEYAATGGGQHPS